MKDHAYHLQALAHSAVAEAIASGELTRRPCETCGEVGQAHHDSYYPEHWLKVRWLCRRHHGEWHAKNQAEWPTIYEYHPSDVEDLHPSKKPGLWYRKLRQSWYVQLGKKQVCLGKDFGLMSAKW